MKNDGANKQQISKRWAIYLRGGGAVCMCLRGTGGGLPMGFVETCVVVVAVVVAVMMADVGLNRWVLWVVVGGGSRGWWSGCVMDSWELDSWELDGGEWTRGTRLMFITNTSFFYN